jgi:hypothetical protein
MLPKAANAAAGLEKIPEIFGRGMVDGGGRDGKNLAENAGDFFEGFGEFGVFRGVFGGEASDTTGGFSVIVAEEQRFAVRRRSENAGIGIKDLAIEFFDLQVASDVGAKRAEGVCESGGMEAGIEFLSDGATTNEFAAFENERLEAALGQIKCGDECVVPAADENYALSEGHNQFAAPRRAPDDFVTCAREAGDHCLRMTWLAMRPLAPMMPPPGCVAEPHI